MHNGRRYLMSGCFIYLVFWLDFCLKHELVALQQFCNIVVDKPSIEFVRCFFNVCITLIYQLFFIVLLVLCWCEVHKNKV